MRISVQYMQITVIVLKRTGKRRDWELVREKGKSCRQSAIRNIFQRGVGTIKAGEVLELQVCTLSQSRTRNWAGIPPKNALEEGRQGLKFSPHPLNVFLGAGLQQPAIVTFFLICTKAPCGPAAALSVPALVTTGAAVSHRQTGQRNPGQS